jgi:hypothetical protein
VTLFSGANPHGQVSVNGSGDVTIQVTGGSANTTYALQFCPFPTTRYTCFSLGSLTTDGTGAVQSTFHFPKTGPWAGDFQANGIGGTGFSTQVGSNAGQTFLATLQPASVTNGQGTGRDPTSSSTPQDRGSGTLSVNGGMVHVVLVGAAPNATYEVTQCFESAGSGCFQLGPFNGNTVVTDAGGNATFDVPFAGIPGDFFTVEQVVSSPSLPSTGFAAGFKVP